MESWSLKWWSRYTIKEKRKFYKHGSLELVFFRITGATTWTWRRTQGEGSWECLKPSPEVDQGRFFNRNFSTAASYKPCLQVTDRHSGTGAYRVPWRSHRSDLISRHYNYFHFLFPDLTEEFGSEDGGFQGELPEGRHCRLWLIELMNWWLLMEGVGMKVEQFCFWHGGKMSNEYV